MEIGVYIKRFSQAFTILLIIPLFISISQTAYSQNISAKQAKSIILQLNKEESDTARFNKFIKLARFQILKPGELKPDLDSAKNYLLQASGLLKKMHSTNAIGSFDLICSDYYNESGQAKNANTYLEKAILYLKSGNDQSLLGEAYENSCYRLALTLPNIPKKINFMQLAAAAYSKTTNKRKQGDCMRLLADMGTIVSASDRALPELDSAKSLYKQANSGDWQQLYIVYAKYYAIQDDYKKALEAILNALRVTSPGDSSSEVCELDHHAAILFIKTKDFKQGLLYGKKALVLAEKRNNSSDVYEIALTLAKACSGLGEPKEALKLMNQLEATYPVHENDDSYEVDQVARLLIYNDLKLNSKGVFCFNYLTKIISKRVAGDNREINEILTQMIPFCINTGQYRKAEELMSQKESITTQLGAKFTARVNNLRLWLRLDTTKKDFKSATNHLLKLSNLNDSLFNETQTRQLQEMEVRYQIERKENENSLQKQKILNLSEQQKVQRAELKAAGVTRNITLISAVCAIVIAGLIYRQYINGKKTNKLIGEKNKRLERLLDENEWLMKEVHHRVKNNLQIITSLLHSQSAYMEEGVALDAIMKSKGRVETIALIHQKLYRTENQSSIYMPEYIDELIGYLKDCCMAGQYVLFDVSIDPVYLDVSDAVPMGLIINEAVTNSIKHAFANNNENTIIITLKKSESEYVLLIRDNGKGFNNNKSLNKNSFGLLLIKGLAEDLGGKLEIFNAEGMVIRLAFQPNSISKELREQLTVVKREKISEKNIPLTSQVI